MDPKSNDAHHPAPPRVPQHDALHSCTYGTFEALQKQQSENPSKMRFLSTLHQFLRHKGDESKFSQVPILGGEFLDFFSLYRTVERHGGYDNVTKRGMWSAVARELNIQSFMDGMCNPLRRWYETFLRSFEEVIRIKVARHQSKNASNSGASKPAVPATQSQTSSSSNPVRSQSHPQPTQSQPDSKRPRVEQSSQLSTAPFVPKHEANSVPERVTIDKTSVENAIRNLRSKRLSDVIMGLNYLNQASMEPDQIQLQVNRSPFYIDQYPLVIVALGELLDLFNPVTNILLPLPDYTSSLLEKNDKYCWNVEDPVAQQRDMQVSCFKYLDSNKLLLSILNVIRNITFEVTNIQLVSYSSAVIRHITAILLLSSPESCIMMEATSYALDILYHIAPHIDITGIRRLKKPIVESWMSNPFDIKSVDSELLYTAASKAFSATSKEAYSQATSYIFPLLFRWMRCPDRNIVLRTVKTIGRLCSVLENMPAVDVMCPDDDLAYLVNLLCVNVTSVECLGSIRQPKMHLFPKFGPKQIEHKADAGLTIDFNDFCDISFRGAVLETLYSLCIPFSTTLKERIASQPRCIEIIAGIALRCCNKPKSDRYTKEAAALLTSLASEPKNRDRIMPVVSALSRAAMEDDAIAELMMSSYMKQLIQGTTPF